MPTIVKTRQSDARKSSVRFSLGEFGVPIALFCVTIALVMAAYLLDAEQSPTVWQETGVIP